MTGNAESAGVADAVDAVVDGTDNYLNGTAKLTDDATAALLDALETDPHRRPFERETRVLWSSEGDRCEIYTAHRPTAKRLLCHPNFALEWFEYADAERSKTTHRGEPADIGDRWSGQTVYGLEGTLPIGAVTLKSEPRTDSTPAQVVSRVVLENDPRDSGGGNA